MQAKMVTDVTLPPSARGDTFAFAEDDDELFEGPTASSLSARGHQLKPTQQPIADFGRKPHHWPETTLEMTEPPRLLDIIFQKTPDVTMTPVSRIVPLTEKVPTMSETPETTTVPITAATTEAPDPDALVCSGRPFDAFMRLKNGTIYAFRGQ